MLRERHQTAGDAFPYRSRLIAYCSLLVTYGPVYSGAMSRACWILFVTLIAGCGRIEREISITSNPPGALVWANDQEIGRTPMTRDFLWYGTYDVVLRKDGYEALHTRTKVIAPWWQWPPIDLAVEILPWQWKDQRKFTYTLKPASTQPADPEIMLNRAEQMRIRLVGSRYTRNPATIPVTKPSTTQSTQPATTQPTQPATTQSGN
jgi:hypothetical protein